MTQGREGWRWCVESRRVILDGVPALALPAWWPRHPGPGVVTLPWLPERRVPAASRALRHILTCPNCRDLLYYPADCEGVEMGLAEILRGNMLALQAVAETRRWRESEAVQFLRRARGFQPAEVQPLLWALSPALALHGVRCGHCRPRLLALTPRERTERPTARLISGALSGPG